MTLIVHASHYPRVFALVNRVRIFSEAFATRVLRPSRNRTIVAIQSEIVFSNDSPHTDYTRLETRTCTRVLGIQCGVLVRFVVAVQCVSVNSSSGSFPAGHRAHHTYTRDTVPPLVYTSHRAAIGTGREPFRFVDDPRLPRALLDGPKILRAQ